MSSIRSSRSLFLFTLILFSISVLAPFGINAAAHYCDMEMGEEVMHGFHSSLHDCTKMDAMRVINSVETLSDKYNDRDTDCKFMAECMTAMDNNWSDLPNLARSSKVIHPISLSDDYPAVTVHSSTIAEATPQTTYYFKDTPIYLLISSFLN